MNNHLPNKTKIKVLRADHNELSAGEIVEIVKYLPKFGGYEVVKESGQKGMFVGDGDFEAV